MSPSYLKDLLMRGKEVQFDFGANRYVLKGHLYSSTTEFAFGRKYGEKVSSSYFDEFFYYRRVDGYSPSEMLQGVSSSCISIC